VVPPVRVGRFTVRIPNPACLSARARERAAARRRGPLWQDDTFAARRLFHRHLFGQLRAVVYASLPAGRTAAASDGLNRRSNRELVTTLTLENAMAAPAIHGNCESSPTAATGMPSVL